MFEPGTSREDAFDELGGHDPGTELGAWVAAVETYLGVSRAELIARLPEPGGVLHRSVRHPLKEQLTPKLVAAITDRARLQAKYPELYAGAAATAAGGAPDAAALQQADRAASHRLMLEVTARLSSADRGTIAEQWYVKMYASGEAIVHARFSRDELANHGIALPQDRVPDLIDGTRLKEIKHVTGPLDARVRAQLKDFAKLIDRPLTVNGKPMRLDSMAVVFTDPAGVRANADYIVTLLSEGRGMTAEIFNGKGERKVVGANDLGKSAFNPTGTDEGLAAAIRTFADQK